MSRLKKAFSALMVAALVIGCACIMPQQAVAYVSEAPLPYRIHVSRTAQLVTVYDSKTGEMVRQMICSTGLSGTPTRTGTFKIPKTGYGERKLWYNFGGSTMAHYATRIKGGYLFHSILYSRASTSSLNRTSWSKLGSRASHGCVRLTPLDAQWIAYNCAPGTIVRINDSKPQNAPTSNGYIKRTLGKPKSNGSVGVWEPTLKPTPKPGPLDKPTLQVGVKGPLTKAMQNYLRSLGHYTGAVNGKFDESTKDALESFQATYLAANPDTADETSVDGLGTPVWQIRVKEGKSTLALAGTRRTLKLGRAGVSVKVLRSKLLQLRFMTAKATTKYDAATREAVKLYQKANGLTANGTATQAVQQAILADERQPLSYARVNLKKGVTVRRSAASTSKGVIRLKNNQRLRVAKVDGDWSLIAVGSKFGFVKSVYLTPEV